MSRSEVGNVCPALRPSWFLVLISTPGMSKPFLPAHPLSFLNILFPVHTPPSWTPSPTCPHTLLPARIPLSCFPILGSSLLALGGTQAPCEGRENEANAETVPEAAPEGIRPLTDPQMWPSWPLPLSRVSSPNAWSFLSIPVTSLRCLHLHSQTPKRSH